MAHETLNPTEITAQVLHQTIDNFFKPKVHGISAEYAPSGFSHADNLPSVPLRRRIKFVDTRDMHSVKDISAMPQVWVDQYLIFKTSTSYEIEGREVHLQNGSDRESYSLEYTREGRDIANIWGERDGRLFDEKRQLSPIEIVGLYETLSDEHLQPLDRVQRELAKNLAARSNPVRRLIKKLF